MGLERRQHGRQRRDRRRGAPLRLSPAPPAATQFLSKLRRPQIDEQAAFQSPPQPSRSGSSPDGSPERPSCSCGQDQSPQRCWAARRLRGQTALSPAHLSVRLLLLLSLLVRRACDACWKLEPQTREPCTRQAASSWETLARRAAPPPPPAEPRAFFVPFEKWGPGFGPAACLTAKPPHTSPPEACSLLFHHSLQGNAVAPQTARWLRHPAQPVGTLRRLRPPPQQTLQRLPAWRPD